MQRNDTAPKGQVHLYLLVELGNSGRARDGQVGRSLAGVADLALIRHFARHFRGRSLDIFSTNQGTIELGIRRMPPVQMQLASNSWGLLCTGLRHILHRYCPTRLEGTRRHRKSLSIPVVGKEIPRKHEGQARSQGPLGNSRKQNTSNETEGPPRVRDSEGPRMPPVQDDGGRMRYAS